MIYDVKGERWEYLVYTSLKDKQFDFRENQDIIFDEIDELYEKLYKRPYFFE